MATPEDQHAAEAISDAKAKPLSPIVIVIRNPLTSVDALVAAIRRALEGSEAQSRLRTGKTADGSDFVELTWLERTGSAPPEFRGGGPCLRPAAPTLRPPLDYARFWGLQGVHLPPLAGPGGSRTRRRVIPMEHRWSTRSHSSHVSPSSHVEECGIAPHPA